MPVYVDNFSELLKSDFTFVVRKFDKRYRDVAGLHCHSEMTG